MLRLLRKLLARVPHVCMALCDTLNYRTVLDEADFPSTRYRFLRMHNIERRKGTYVVYTIHGYHCTKLIHMNRIDLLI